MLNRIPYMRKRYSLYLFIVAWNVKCQTDRSSVWLQLLIEQSLSSNLEYKFENLKIKDGKFSAHDPNSQPVSSEEVIRNEPP